MTNEPPKDSDGVKIHHNEDDEFRSHSFRERRLTYSRHHILSDNAAAAVAQLLAESDGDDFHNNNNNDRRHRRRSDSSANSDASKPYYLPSRILHAGEIVRRHSSDNDNNSAKNAADVRTGAYSHPTHKKYVHHHHQQQHLSKDKKWRQRYSFCLSTTPDHVLPFPRNVVGTFSCHGMEPVYDSDYDDSSDDDDQDENYEGEEGVNNESDEDVCNDCQSATKSVHTNNNKSIRTTTANTTIAKINQDRGGVIYPYANSHTMALFAVYDGHGEGGELVSQFALGEVSRILGGMLIDYESKKKKNEVNGGKSSGGDDKINNNACFGGNGRKKRRRKGMLLSDDRVNGETEESSHDDNANNDEQCNKNNEDKIIEQFLKETFIKVDRGLLDEAEIEPMYSGTTACVILMRHKKLYIANCGDSRAVLARCQQKKRRNKCHHNHEGSQPLLTIPLSIDQNPDSRGEKERILNSGGYVSPPPEPGLSARVWLDPNMTQIGLAMARSIGDHAVKGVGVIAEPVVSVHNVDEELDEFVIIASDGVWEFISSEGAVDIVGRLLHETNEKHDDDEGNEVGKPNDRGASEACEALIKAATAKWHEFEGDYRDDITAIVIRLKDLW